MSSRRVLCTSSAKRVLSSDHDQVNHERILTLKCSTQSEHVSTCLRPFTIDLWPIRGLSSKMKAIVVQYMEIGMPIPFIILQTNPHDYIFDVYPASPKTH